MKELHVRLSDTHYAQLEKVIALEPGVRSNSDALRFVLDAYAGSQTNLERRLSHMERLLRVVAAMVALGFDRLLVKGGDNEREFVIPPEETHIYCSADELASADIKRRVTQSSRNDRLGL